MITIVKAPDKLGVLDQLAVAAQPEHRLALAAGAILGGLVPLASYVVAHVEARGASLEWVLVVAGMLYSATSVYEWGAAAFRNPAKALGFVVLIEGVSLFATTTALSLAAVAVLVVINAALTGCNLIADRKTSRAAGARPTSRARRKTPAIAITRTAVSTLHVAGSEARRRRRDA